MVDNKLALKILEDRIMLLSQGIIVPPRNWWRPIYHLQSFRGGPGPQGRIYYVSYNEEEIPEKMISIPVYPRNYYLAKYAIMTKRDKKNPHNLIIENGIVLKGVQPFRAPKNIVFSDGGEIRKSGLINIHCYGTYATNIFWVCKHFEKGEQCRFCTLEVATKKYRLLKRQSDEHIIEALRFTTQNKKIRSLTITSGTYLDACRTANDIITLLKKIKQSVNISIHVQLEPINDTSILKELAKYADSIGIFLEIFDEEIRRTICPGKARIVKEEYFKVWQEAVKYFGWGNVWTTCLLGFGEDYQVILREIEKAIKLGVRCSLLFARPGSKYLGRDFIPTYLGKNRELLDLHIKVAKILIDNGLEAKVGGGSGCIGCYGCSAMVEACEYLKSLS